MRIGCLTLVLCLAACSAAPAQDWAKAMFDHLNHDFGVVARGAEVEHRFPLKNIYLEDARIQSVRSSCGCTIPQQLAKSLLKTYETTEIVAKLDTRKFTGQKDATLTVTFDLPFPAEVQLKIYSYIRSDVVLQPGAVTFGSVVQGKGAQGKAVLSYAGSNTWQVTGVKPGGNPAISVRVQETGRNLNLVNYEISVELRPDAPLGYFRDVVRLTTNDANPRAGEVILPVEGVVMAPLAVRPSPLLFGIVRAGETTSRNLVIQADSPLRILAVAGPDPRFSIAVPAGAQKIHVLPVTLSAGQSAGKIEGKIILQTDRPGYERLEVPVDGQIVSEEAEKTP